MLSLHRGKWAKETKDDLKCTWQGLIFTHEEMEASSSLIWSSQASSAEFMNWEQL